MEPKEIKIAEIFKLAYINKILKENNTELYVRFVNTHSNPKIPFATTNLKFQVQQNKNQEQEFYFSAALNVFPYVSADSNFHNIRVKEAKRIGRDPKMQQKIMLSSFLNSQQENLSIVNDYNMGILKSLKIDGFFDQELESKIVINQLLANESIQLEDVAKRSQDLAKAIEIKITSPHQKNSDSILLQQLGAIINNSPKPYAISENGVLIDENEEPVTDLTEVKLLSEEEASKYRGKGNVVNFSKF